MTIDPDFINLERKANDAMSVAAMRGYELPAEYVSANAVAAAASKFANAAAPGLTELPSKPEDVAKWIAKTAKDRAEWRETKAVAAELKANSTRQALAAAYGAAPAYARHVIDEFPTLLAEFNRLGPIAPRNVNGHTTPEQFALHAELLRTVEAMTQAALDRGRLAMLLDEAEEIGSDGLWLVMDPVPTSSIGGVTEVLAEFRGRLPMTVAEWERVALFGISMAGSGEVAARRGRYIRAMHANSGTADRGMIDKTYAEATALVGAA